MSVPSPTAQSCISCYADVLGEESYVRERLKPRLTDVNYLHLKDLLALVQPIAADVTGDVFDYGCGGAPYRRLFSRCKSYVAADVTHGPAVDRLLQSDNSTTEANASYDCVISTQVLEHIKDPEAYIRECHRILRPGGQLILTTHGMIEEHGCPFDFQRWTSGGLNELISRCQFQISESGKLTTEMRAVVQLLNQMVLHFRCPESFLRHVILAVARKIYGGLLMPCLNGFAGFFQNQARVPASDPASLYVCVFVRAVKP